MTAAGTPPEARAPAPAGDPSPPFTHEDALDRALAADPAGAYARMDTATRAQYRNACRTLAGWSGRAPAEVAAEALALAREPGAGPARAGHVGCYLLAEGRARLEQRLGCRAPLAVRCARLARRHAPGAYVGAIAALAALAWLFAYRLLGSCGAPLGLRLGAGLLLVVPALNVAAALVDTAVQIFLPTPSPLPRMEPGPGGAQGGEAFVVMPVLLAGPDDLAAQLAVLEMNYLNNPGAGLRFALLTDFTDAPAERIAADGRLLEALARGVEALNERHAHGATKRFFYFHRARRWSPSEGCFMGWERKRGKLCEFNRLLAGASDTSYVAHNAPPGGPGPARYVITLDADNLLPPGAAAALVATLEHPLNRPQLDAASGRVIAGYGALQPRVEFSPRPAQSLLRRIFLGPSLVRLHTLGEPIPAVHHALFGTGHFIGKGIYDVEAFGGPAGRLPEGRVLSHDRIEGMYARTGYASDVVVFEDYPFDIVGWLRRWHRWARGDWQALAWALPRVPVAGGRSERNPLRPIDRWSLTSDVLDQLHSSATLALLVAGWLTLRQGLAAWTITLALAAQHRSIVPPLGIVLRALRQRSGLPALARVAGRVVPDALGGIVLGSLFSVPHAFTMSDAVARASYRLAVSRKLLLQWTAQALVERQGRGARAMLLGLKAGPLLAASTGAGLALLGRSEALSMAAPFLALWSVGPLFALWAGGRMVPAPPQLPPAAKAQLRALARRSWALYEQACGGAASGKLTRGEPASEGPAASLPPTLVREHSWEAAPRTSPSEAAFLLLGALGAHDLGYLGITGLNAWVGGTLRRLAGLERHRGHFLEAYELPELRPVSPRRVSTEQSGWLAAALLALEAGLGEARAAAVPGRALVAGLADTAAVLYEVLAAARGASHAATGDRLLGGLSGLRDELASAALDPGSAAERTERALDRLTPDWEAWRELAPDAATDFWWARLRGQAALVAREVERWSPWRALLRAAPAPSETPAAIRRLLERMAEGAHEGAPLERLAEACREARGALSALGAGAGDDDAWRSWGQRTDDALARVARDADEARAELEAAAAEARRMREAMSFAFLYDARRDLLHAGYAIEAGELDGARQEQLASGGRLASFVAVAGGDVPARHWTTLGRASVRDGRGRRAERAALADYVMPSLLLRTPAQSRLALSAGDEIDAQADFAARHGVPWGFEGPACAQSPGALPAVAPHLSLASLRVRPAKALDNLGALAGLGAIGTCGLFASVAARRADEGAAHGAYRPALQGAAVVAVTDALDDHRMVRRLHAGARAERLDFLLYEATPDP